MADDYYAYDDEEAAPKRHDNLFLWTVFILLLIGLAFACWLGSFYVFGHPEQPRAYQFLKKLGKIEAPRRFIDIAAPPGEFLGAQKFFERYSKFTRLELERENAELLRNYINNYRETKKLVPYLRGSFTVVASQPLTADRFISPGLITLMQSDDFPQIIVEHVFPASGNNQTTAQRLMVTGIPFRVERSKDLSAVIHVEKVPDGRILLTAVPLLYGGYAFDGSVGTFNCETPHDLNVQGGVPVLKPAELEQGIKAFAEYRRSQPVNPLAGNTEKKADQPGIVQLPAQGTDIPTKGALPEVTVATPIPAAGHHPGSHPTPVATYAANATPRPLPVATPLANNTNIRPLPTPFAAATTATPAPLAPAPTPNRFSPTGVPLTPFISSNQSPGAATAGGGTWRMYAPGRQPAARAISPSEATALADRGEIGERVYLKGQFVVTASGENRAILRPQAGAQGPVRIIVEYPNGAAPPPEGATFDRDDVRPYEIHEVHKGASGEVNVWVREIISQ